MSIHADMEDLYIMCEKSLRAELGRELTLAEIEEAVQDHYSCYCDHVYESLKERL